MYNLYGITHLNLHGQRKDQLLRLEVRNLESCKVSRLESWKRCGSNTTFLERRFVKTRHHMWLLLLVNPFGDLLFFSPLSFLFWTAITNIVHLMEEGCFFSIMFARWRDETARSSISRGIASKIIPNLPIWGIKSELRGILVKKGRIHRELRYFWDIFWKLIKLDDELRWEIRENGRFRKITQRSIRGIKNCLIWISNHGEIKDGSGRKFSDVKNRDLS